MSFRHEALLYAGAADFADRATPIIAGAVEAGEPVLVAVDQAKIELLRARLGEAAGAVIWKDIRGVGRNPARIIPLWRRFVTTHASSRVWGFGEPVWAGRTPAELVEAQRHEELLNLAFATSAGFTLLCPYDTEALDPDVVRAAGHSHPFMEETAGAHASGRYPGLEALSAPHDAPLPEPDGKAEELVLDPPSAGLRVFLAGSAAVVGDVRIDDLTAAVAAVAATMGRAAGGSARLRMWSDASAVVAEIRGLAAVDDPLAGREWPPPADGPARGLWLANQLCDLVQLRSSGDAAAVRLLVAAD